MLSVLLGVGALWGDEPSPDLRLQEGRVTSALVTKVAINIFFNMVSPIKRRCLRGRYAARM